MPWLIITVSRPWWKAPDIQSPLTSQRLVRHFGISFLIVMVLLFHSSGKTFVSRSDQAIPLTSIGHSLFSVAEWFGLLATKVGSNVALSWG